MGERVASLLHPLVAALVVQPPAPDSSRGAEHRDGARTVKIAGTGQVKNSAVVVSQCVLRGSVGHEHDVVLAAQAHTLVEVNRGAAGTEGVGSGGRVSGLNRELYIRGEGKSGHGDGRRRYWHAHTPVLHRDSSGSRESEDVALALGDGLVSVIADD